MKKIITVLIAVLTYFNSYAQDPQLFENDWYLQKVIIDGIDYFPPNNSEVDNVVLVVAADNFYTLACDVISGDGIDITNDFINIETFNVFPEEICFLEDTLTFLNIYFNIFFNWQGFDNAYAYSIETGSAGLKILTLVNEDGYIAIYSNQILSNQEFNSTSFTIYPNPVNNMLQITNNSNNAITKIQVYDVLGKLVLRVNNPINQLDVSSLNSGLFFVQIITDSGVVTKKIIKE